MDYETIESTMEAVITSGFEMDILKEKFGIG